MIEGHLMPFSGLHKTCAHTALFIYIHTQIHMNKKRAVRIIKPLWSYQLRQVKGKDVLW